tara:strand:+ start:214 stop:537 length:324 start_codon:yes stop_codon:yes gene_type:complete
MKDFIIICILAVLIFVTYHDILAKRSYPYQDLLTYSLPTYISNIYSPQFRENFTPSFNDCRASGYSKEFCVQTPLANPYWSPASCLCPDGRPGQHIPGFRGQCVCAY